MEAVVDTSIVIALLTGEKERQHILQITEDYELVCAASIETEIGNAVSAMFRRKRISLAQGKAIIDGFQTSNFRTFPLNLSRALEISYRCNIYAYDAYVLECAERLNAPLLTLDHGMKQAATTLEITLIEV